MCFNNSVANYRRCHRDTDSDALSRGELIGCLISTIKLCKCFVVVECDSHAIQVGEVNGLADDA